jgi:hypothetical protein
MGVCVPLFLPYIKIQKEKFQNPIAEKALRINWDLVLRLRSHDIRRGRQDDNKTWNLIFVI